MHPMTEKSISEVFIGILLTMKIIIQEEILERHPGK